MSRRPLIPRVLLLGLLAVLAGAACGSRVIGSAATVPAGSPASTGASVDPHALTVANVTRSLHDNAGFMPLTTLDNLRVTIPSSADEVDIEARPNLVLDEHTFLLQAGSDALEAAKAIFGWYPSVQRISVTLDGTFTDAASNSTVQPGVSVTLGSDTVGAWSAGTVAAPDASTVLCYADSYAINPIVWDVLSPIDRGCLTQPTG
jgi:hypothetical protein